jgi:hypothetical protein
MTRRILLAVALAATIVAGCGGPPPAPALTDPRDILVHGLSSLQTLKTVHLKATLTGKVDTGVLSGKPTGAKIDLTGSTLEGDLDVAGREVKLSVSVPSILGLSGDLVVDAGTVYVKTSLSGPRFQKFNAASIPGLPQALSSPPSAPSPDPSAVADMSAGLLAELNKLPAPVKLADDRIGDQDCYHVQQKLTTADVPQLQSVVGNLAGALTVDVWTRKSDYRPARLVIAVDGGAQGTATISVDLSGYDAAVTIDPPPADQVSNDPFSIPSMPFLP